MDEARAENLDELVHEVASNMASNAINEGRQIAFLMVCGWSETEINQRLDEMGK